MKSLVLFLVIFSTSAVFANASSKSSKSYKVVCYLGSWANYRPGDGKFVIENINPQLCSHLIYGFAKLSPDNRIAPYDPYLDLKENWGLGAYQRFNGLKEKNPNLKTLIAIGGWNEGSTKYSAMASNSASRKTFVDSSVDFLKKYGFDGLDLDWEYPANRGGKPEDKQNFVSLVKELKEAFEPHGFLLTAAVSAGKKTIDSAYDIPALSKYMDFINLMAYDFHGGWDKFTGHNAPLYARSNETEENKNLNVDYAVNYWLSKGCPADKLILGMPLYGRNFNLQDTKKNGLDAPVNGKGMAGQFTREPGMMGYNEICNVLKNEKGWNTVFEPTIQGPYAFKERQWIGYDNQKSIYLKAQYLKKMNLGGGMVWSIETDDFRGRCHGQDYPLLRTINECLERSLEGTTRSVQENSITPDVVKKHSSISSTSTSSPKTTPKATTPTAKATSDGTTPASKAISDGTTPASKPELTTGNEVEDSLPCPSSGYYKHPKDCKSFYYCRRGVRQNENVYYNFKCGEGTVFSEKLGVCTFPYSVPGCS